jgi:hypothetical protein
MALKNPTTNPRRFRVERVYARFAIVDTATLAPTLCPPGTSLFEAEQQCAARNGTGAVRKSPEPTSLIRQFQNKGVTAEDIDASHEAYDRVDEDSLWPSYFAPVLSVDGGAYRVRVRGENEAPPRRPVVGKQRRQLVDAYKKWMPDLLRDWADGVAAQCGYGGDRRAQWSTWAILNLIRTDTIRELAPEADPAIRGLHFFVTPSTYFEPDSSENLQRREVLAMHYLSAADPARIKAAFLGMSKATYLKYLDAGHRLVARRWLS